MAHMERLSEGASEEEAAAIHSTLNIFESFVEAVPACAADLAQKAGLLLWLLNRLKARRPRRRQLSAWQERGGRPLRRW